MYTYIYVCIIHVYIYIYVCMHVCIYSIYIHMFNICTSSSLMCLVIFSYKNQLYFASRRFLPYFFSLSLQRSMCFSIVDFLEYFLQFIFTSHRHVRAFLIFLAIALPNPSTTSVLLCCCTPPLVFRVCSAFTSECCSVTVAACGRFLHIAL